MQGKYILGSHDSLTYLPVRQWYFKPFKWCAQCQRIRLTDQMNQYNVRLFDLRVRFEKNERGFYHPIIAHGPIVFNMDVNDVLHILNNGGLVYGNIYCRILLESNHQMKDQAEQEDEFIKFCATAEAEYPEVYFFGGNRKYDWKRIYKFENEDIDLDDKYSSTTSLFKPTKYKWLNNILKVIDDFCPFIYAAIMNKKIYKAGTDKQCLFIDFVDMGRTDAIKTNFICFNFNK